MPAGEPFAEADVGQDGYKICVLQLGDGISGLDQFAGAVVEQGNCRSTCRHRSRPRMPRSGLCLCFLLCPRKQRLRNCGSEAVIGIAAW